VGRVANGVTRRFSDKAARPFQLKKAARSGLLDSNVTIDDDGKRNAVWFSGERLVHTSIIDKTGSDGNRSQQFAVDVKLSQTVLR
jgi:hypothetical protein